MRRIVACIACVMVAGTLPLVDGVAHAVGTSSRASVTVKIVGTDKFLPNGDTATYHFPDAPIKVQQGGTITFVNQTDDGHTMTLVASSAVPTSFDCPLCDAVNGMYFTTNGPPSIFQIDNGMASDDDSGTADADATDPAANAPFPGVLTEDFDTPGTYAADGTPVVGDSTIVGPVGSPVTERTVVMTASPGTYDFICTLHPWMHGTIVVQ